VVVVTPNILNDDALERIDGAFAFFRRVLNDAEFREQLPDHAGVGIVLRSGEALMPQSNDPAEPKIVYWPEREMAMVVEPDHAREIVLVRS
jgi:hypothetical protein